MQFLPAKSLAKSRPFVTSRASANAFINVKSVHHTVTAQAEIANSDKDGVIIAQTGYFGGSVLYMKEGGTKLTRAAFTNGSNPGR